MILSNKKKINKSVRWNNLICTNCWGVLTPTRTSNESS